MTKQNENTNGTLEDYIPEEQIQRKKVTQQHLESHLWESANILRGSIDSSDYKNYIFGLLFLKRINDVFNEEAIKEEKELLKGDYTEADAKKLAWEDEDFHQFFVPKRARWSEIRKITQDIGDKLNKAFEELENKNSVLQGVLSSVDFNDKERLPDEILSKLLLHFTKIRLRNSDLTEPDIMGRAYEYLIKQFADDAGKKGGEFYTPRGVVKLIVQLIQPEESMRICDPTVGSGGMLIECAKYVEEQGGNLWDLSLYGQEKNLNTWAICKMNMLFHDLLDADIKKGDTIREPKLLEGGELMLFDRVIANPPFSLKNWGRETAENDGFQRFRFGVPPKSYGEMAFLQHMIATINVNGKIGVVMPHGVLFRGGAEKRIREGILQEDLLEAVIGLAPKLFYGTRIPASILIINKNKPAERKNKIFFIDASKDYEEGKAQNALREKDIEKIVNAYSKGKDIEKFCKSVDLEEIKENDFNLNISLYVFNFEEEEEIDIQQVLDELKVHEKEREELNQKVQGYLEELGFE